MGISCLANLPCIFLPTTPRIRRLDTVWSFNASRGWQKKETDRNPRFERGVRLYWVLYSLVLVQRVRRVC